MNLNKIDYFTCKFEIGQGERNEDFFKERDFLGGWTISNRHPVKGLKRISSDTIIAQNTVMEIKPSVLRDLLENTIKLYATDKNIIFLSGGKDSTALAHAFKTLNIPFKAVSLYSKLSPTTEIDIVKSIQKELNIDVIYYAIDTIPKTEFKYWIENPYTAKVIAINELGLQNYTIFTGEIGTGEMQVNQSLQYTAMMGYRPDDLAFWHVNVCGSYRKLNSVKKLSNDPIYLECVEHFKTRFNQWAVHPDILNRVMFSRLQDEGAYRLFNYGLDDLSWVHPYAENSFIRACVNMPSKYKGKKNLYREMYNDLTDIPWRYPKSGLGIQTV
tara:strand:+ start:3303 stop:4286 length:984 start_codon:yes stop_codon:yes gene_type:complete